MPSSPVSTFEFDDLFEGFECSLEAVITELALDQFARVTGDVSNLHMDSEFARSRGFQGRVVHGAYFGGLVSCLIGTRLPGRNALIHQTQLVFHAPGYIGDKVTVIGKIERKIDSVRAILVSIRIIESGSASEGRQLVTGKVQVGFTRGEPSGHPESEKGN